MIQIQSVKEIKVGLDFGEGAVPVGRLAILNHQIYFEYDRAFIANGLEISPIRLPLKVGVSTFEHSLFEGLPGVFNDSLPDGWGRLLFDRFARSQGIVPSDITTLDRLTQVGHYGMGALVYQPDYSDHEAPIDVDLDTLATQAQEVLAGTSDEVLAELIALNGSSAGARPKVLVGVNPSRDHLICGVHELNDDYSHWLLKFPNTQDGLDSGVIEYVYSLMAKAAGILMPEAHLFPAKLGPGYFAIQRFDRAGNQRYHMHTACGLLHSDFRTPSMDYEDLIALTAMLTRDIQEVEKMYRLAVFNVLAHNRDDHSKNFSFLMDRDGQWKLSPAYDLTFSSGPRGEQSIMVMGEGRKPSTEHLLKLAQEASLKKGRAQEIIAATKASLARWPELASQHGVSKANIKLIQSKLAG